MEKNFKLHNQLAPKKKKGGGGGDNRDDSGGRENTGFKTKGRDGGERSESFDKPKFRKGGNDRNERRGNDERRTERSEGWKKDKREFRGNDRRERGDNKSGEWKGEKREYKGRDNYSNNDRRSDKNDGWKRDKKEFRGRDNRDNRDKSDNRDENKEHSSERPYKRERSERDYKNRDGGGYRGNRDKNDRGGDRKGFYGKDRGDRKFGRDRDRGNRYDRRDKDSDSYERKSPKESYVIYGKHPVLAALQNKSRVKTKLFVTQNGQEFLRERLGQDIFSTIEVQNVLPDKLDRIIGEQDRVTHQGIGLEVKPLYVNYTPDTENFNRICILDNITDPHNVGAIIRTAKAFGYDAVITEEKNSPNENATICKTSAGVIEIMPYARVASLHNFIEDIKTKGYEVMGLDSSSDTQLEKHTTGKKVALVIGAEGKGLSPHIKRLCDTILSIEIKPEVESLNASVAAALALNKFKA